MSDLAHLQDQLMAINLYKSGTINGILVSGKPAPHRARMAAYAIFSKLSEHLENRFATVRQRVRDEAFYTLCSDYICAHPPTSPTMDEFGDEFTRFLESHPLGQIYPDLSDLARLDGAMSAASRAPVWDADDTGSSVILTPTTTLVLATSLRVLDTIYPVTLIRDALEAGTDLSTVDITPSTRTYAIYAMQDAIHVRPIDSAIAVFLNAILSGCEAYTAYAEAVVDQDEGVFKQALRAQVIDAPFALLA